MKDQIKFHIALNVSDISKTTSFYKALFGEEPVKVKEDYVKFELENPGLVISFIQSPAKVSANFGHLGLRVESEKELYDRKTFIEGKIQIELEEQNTNCCYSHQDKFWVNDPDGYEWEVYYVRRDKTEAQEKRHQLSSCC